MVALAVGLGGVVLLTLAAALWLTLGRPYSETAARLQAISGPLHLQRGTTAQSPWPALRKEAMGPLGRLPSAHGERRGLEVEVGMVPPAGGGHPAMTWVVAKAAASPRAPSLGLSREPSQLASVPSLGIEEVEGGRSGARRAAVEWFGDAVVWGSRNEIDRVFSPTVRGWLQAFPRTLATVAFDENAILLQWFDEQYADDPTVVEQAFSLAAEILATTNRT